MILELREINLELREMNSELHEINLELKGNGGQKKWSIFFENLIEEPETKKRFFLNIFQTEVTAF